MCTVPAIGTVPLVGTGPMVGNGIYTIEKSAIIVYSTCPVAGYGGAFPFSLYGGGGTAMV